MPLLFFLPTRVLVVAPLERSAPAQLVESAPSSTGSPPAIARRRTGAALAVPRVPVPIENWRSFLLPFFTHACWRAAAPAAAESNTILLFNVPARDSVVFHDEIKAARPAQIVVRVDLVVVVAPAFTHPSIDVGERYRAIVRLVNLEFPVAEDPGRRLPQRALTFVLRFSEVTVLRWGSRRRRVS